MSNFANKVRKWYEDGHWTLAMVANAVRKGKITEEEYTEITGKEFES